jgi:hypothetical protein
MTVMKQFICENAHFLSKQNRMDILMLVLNYIGDKPIMKSVDNTDTDINLDSPEMTPEIITHIYNIVNTRRVMLSSKVSY